MRLQFAGPGGLLMLLPAITAAQTGGAGFSGVMFGHWQMRTDSAAEATLGGEHPNRFDIARVYLNFRMPAGERGSIRATTDVFQNTAAGYYAGWAVRFKYAYFQYDATRRLAGVDGLTMVARVGMLHNVIVEHMDSYWPRWMSQNAVETHGFFASADLGAAALVTLPRRRGEAYVTVMNGNGYTAAETDRFKDIAARFSWTPLAGDSGFLHTLAVTPWYSKGRAGGAFQAGGPGQVGPVTDGIQRDRRGVFVGLKDRRLTAGAEWAQRVEDVESGGNTAASPRTVRNRTSTLRSVFALLRPLELADASRRSRLTLMTRLDDFRFDDTPARSSTTLAWFGVLWDLNARSTVTLDYHVMTGKSGNTSVPAQTLFVHWVTSY